MSVWALLLLGALSVENLAAETRLPPSYSKLSEISRKRFEKAFPFIAEHLGHWDELNRRWQQATSDVDEARENLRACEALQLELKESGDLALMAEANRLVEQADRTVLLAGKAGLTAKKAVSRYQIAYDKVLEFQSAVGKANDAQFPSDPQADTVIRGRLDALFASIRPAMERADVKPWLVVTDTCNPLEPCRPRMVAAASPHGAIYVERAFLLTHPSDGVLAFVLAHELAHIDCYHWAQDREVERKLFGDGIPGLLAASLANSTAGSVLLTALNRPQELEADSVGQEYLRRTLPGYAAEGPADFIAWKRGLEKSLVKLVWGNLQKNTRFPSQERKRAEYERLLNVLRLHDSHPQAEERGKALRIEEEKGPGKPKAPPPQTDWR